THCYCCALASERAVFAIIILCDLRREISHVQIFLQMPGHGLDSWVIKSGAIVLFCEDECENVVGEAKGKAKAVARERKR
ncbi:MAG: hypothetical protein M3H12_00675, partial [Chromatiales bacterium]